MNNNKLVQATWFKITAAIGCVLVTVIVLNQVARLMQGFIVISYNWKFELCMVLGTILFQYPFIRKETAKRKLGYYFMMMLVSGMGAVLLVPLLLLNRYHTYSSTFNVVYFLLVILLMFVEHKKRVTKSGLPWLISYTWVLYRFLILLFLLKR